MKNRKETRMRITANEHEWTRIKEAAEPCTGMFRAGQLLVPIARAKGSFRNALNWIEPTVQELYPTSVWIGGKVGCSDLSSTLFSLTRPFRWFSCDEGINADPEIVAG